MATNNSTLEKLTRDYIAAVSRNKERKAQGLRVNPTGEWNRQRAARDCHRGHNSVLTQAEMDAFAVYVEELKAK